MSKVIPINKDPIKNLSDTKFAEIEKDLMEFFHDTVFSNDGIGINYGIIYSKKRKCAFS